MRLPAAILSLFLFCPTGIILAQDAQPEAIRAKDVDDLAEGGTANLPRLKALLTHPDREVRVEAVKAIVQVGTQHSLDPLIQAAGDNDAEVQVRATDGLVNFYLPGYVQTGISGKISRVGTSITGRFTDTNDQVIDPFIQVRPDVVAALGKLARGGMGMTVRANAARAIGILRGSAAVPDLLEAIRTKDTDIIYESLVAFQKIRDKSVAPNIAFLLRDLNPKVQIAAIETTGLLQNKEAFPNLLDVLNRAREAKVRRAALTAIAMLPDESARPVFLKYLTDKDERLRGAAAEGLARLKSTADLQQLERAYEAETKTSARLSMAFGAVMLGKTEISEFSPLQYLVNTLNSASYRGESYALLVELARDPGARTLLYKAMDGGTRHERIYLARTMAVSGDASAVPHLEKLSRDGDGEVAQEGLRALRTLKARL